MADVSNIRVGVCSVTFDGVDLGHTAGGVELTYSPEYLDIKVDLYGNTIVDKALIGEGFMAKVPLAEYTLENLKVAIANATSTGSPSITKLTMGKKVGDLLSTLSGLLVLHPIANDASDLSEDIVIHKAVVHNEIPLSYKFDEQRVIAVEFVALIDESKSDGNYLGLIGDSTT